MLGQSVKGLWTVCKSGRDSAAADGSDGQGQSKASLAENKKSKAKGKAQKSSHRKLISSASFYRAPLSRLKIIGLETCV